MAMTYEACFDEVTTLITKMYVVSEQAAIKQVMRAQAADFFTLHDDILAMRTQERAVSEAKAMYQQIQQERTAAALKQPTPSQQLRQPKQARASTRKK